MSGMNDQFTKAVAKIVVACVVCYTLGLIVAHFWLPLLVVAIAIVAARYLWWRGRL